MQKEQCLATPRSVPPKIAALAQSFRDGSLDAEEIVQKAISWYQDAGFDYTLEPGKYEASGAGMEDFLFTRKQGFCGHFASSFATLMRLAGVPTRIVQGYTGGEHVESYDYYLVRQSDAHVWCEVWQDTHWQRVDPTGLLVPNRLATDLQSFLGAEGSSVFGFNDRNAWYGQLWTRTQISWDALNYQWYEKVVQFDEDAQGALMADWGLMRLSFKKLALLLLGLLLTPLLAIGWWTHRRHQHSDPVVRDWQSFCRRMAKKGAARRPAEGPLDYSDRMAKEHPQLADEIRARAESYVMARFGD
jgi:transglutaminase-like putative cysteine protease